MARGDMGYKSTSVGLGTEILNRTKFEGVSMTIDFTSNTSTDAETGEKLVKAGTPIDKDGKAVAALTIISSSNMQHKPEWVKHLKNAVQSISKNLCQN